MRLRREGFVVETVAGGKELLELLGRADSSREPWRAALVIGDLMMSAFSGWQVLEPRVDGGRLREAVDV
ncbi:MAG TPA: hypothetical protein VFS43_04205 [Polyangiaceae bacterium]|nr:hypothetical protein [Polyangiaceae bacterium]